MGRSQAGVVGRRAGKVGLGYIQASGRGTGGFLVTAQGRQGPIGSSGQIRLLGRILLNRFKLDISNLPSNKLNLVMEFKSNSQSFVLAKSPHIGI